MDFGGTVARVLTPPLQSFGRSTILRFLLGFIWSLFQLLVAIVHLWSRLIEALKSYIISSGLLQKYQNLQLQKLRYLAVVVDSEEAKNKVKIEQLLCWLSAIGVKHVSLYDMEGVLKKSLETGPKLMSNSCIKSRSVSEVSDETPLLHQERMMIELLSLHDGKEAVAKAASFLCSEYLKGDSLNCNKTRPVFSEADMTNSLKAVGCDGPEPDLLLVYGHARCHLGFPAWRIRYTEIVHMGPLKSMKYGAIVKAIYDFLSKHQNYGS